MQAVVGPLLDVQVDLASEMVDRRQSRSRVARPAEVHHLAGEVDLDIEEGTDDRLHVSHLLAELGELDGDA